MCLSLNEETPALTQLVVMERKKKCLSKKEICHIRRYDVFLADFWIHITGPKYPFCPFV